LHFNAVIDAFVAHVNTFIDEFVTFVRAMNRLSVNPNSLSLNRRLFLFFARLQVRSFKRRFFRLSHPARVPMNTDGIDKERD